MSDNQSWNSGHKEGDSQDRDALDNTSNENHSSTASTGFLHEQSWMERNGFPYWLSAIIWVVVAFLLFQLVGNTFAVVYMLMVTDDPAGAFDVTLMLEHLNTIFLGNSIAQILFLGLGTWIVTGLSTTGKRSAFLRFQYDEKTVPVSLQTVLLIVVIQPLVWFLGWINAQVPLPESYMVMEEMQMEMIESFLTADYAILMGLIHVGLVPSVCEEVLFRGYAHRLMEKSWGIWAAIIVGGLLFALFHIRITQFIPLAFIGMLLAWLVWRSESIYPAIVGHFVNNGGSVLLAAFFSDMMSDQLITAERPSFLLVFLSIGATFVVVRYIKKITKRD